MQEQRKRFLDFGPSMGALESFRWEGVGVVGDGGLIGVG